GFKTGRVGVGTGPVIEEGTIIVGKRVSLLSEVLIDIVISEGSVDEGIDTLLVIVCVVDALVGMDIVGSSVVIPLFVV
ncbi:15738_t:CDS:1, partial [Entrophospora sp. SA101]